MSFLMAVTSQPRGSGAFGKIEVKDWKAAGLLKPSVVKPVMATIEQGLVIKRPGRLTDNDRLSLSGALKVTLG